MFPAKVRFGPCKMGRRSRLKDHVDMYLTYLYHHGQIGEGASWTWVEDGLHVDLEVSRPDSMSDEYHSDWGKSELLEISRICGKLPEWTLLHKDLPKRFPRWESAPFLVLYDEYWGVYWDDDCSPIRRGDSGEPIPAYLIPFAEDCVPWNIHCWRSAYCDHMGVWFRTSTLEIPAYKELADPSSELASQGRELCSEIEKATSVPTYYFLFRYWGRREGEADRKCPSCGGNWEAETTYRPQVGSMADRFSVRKVPPCLGNRNLSR